MLELVSNIPPLEVAWNRYQALVLAANENKALWADRDHCTAIFAAYETFRNLYKSEAA